MVPGRHLESFYLSAKAQGKTLPIAIHIGLDPAVYMASCCPSPLVPLGFNELDIASSLRGRPFEISPCIAIDANCISHAEYVLEGEITDEIIPESDSSQYSMPEFLGYNGKVHPGLPVVKIKAITHRYDPVYQTVIGPGYEQSNLLGFGLEAAILEFLRSNVSTNIINAYCSSAGGGYLLLFLQFRKECEQHDGMVKQAALAVFGAFRMIKQIVLVDEDVDVFNEQDVWWAMTTRFQADIDLTTISNVQGFPLDPSQNPDYSPIISSPGLTAKAVFDCTVPYRLKEAFKRVEFS
jgi:4-hydroxy-3-polyprenylbenzoate decarboxylase